MDNRRKGYKFNNNKLNNPRYIDNRGGHNCARIGQAHVNFDGSRHDGDDAKASPFDIPIFTEEFLDHNKTREAELRHLRKINTEYEEENAVLSMHIENMNSAIDKLVVESLCQKNTNKALEDHLNRLKTLIVTQFSNFPIPGTNDAANTENVEAYLRNLSSKVNEEKGFNKEYDIILEKVNNIIAQIDS